MQCIDYYPFGLTHQQPLDNPPNKYLYNGKELQTEMGLNWYDYGARFYDPSIGRWSTVDPAASKYSFISPYSYVYNNPIIFLDPDGEDPIDFLNGLINAVVTNHHPTQSGRGLGAPASGSVARSDYNAGQTAGDYVSLVVGLGETLIGGTEAVAGVAGAPETLGASLVLTAEGAAIAVEGLNVIKNAASSLGENNGRVYSEGTEPTRRTQTEGDKDLPSERAARREVFRQNKVPTSESNNFKREKVYGKSQNLLGPNGEPSEVIKTKDLNGNDVTIDHHNNGHIFKDNNTYELPHYQGPQGQHYNYPPNN